MALNKDKRAIVLLSGGLDSTTTLAIAKAEGFEVYALTLNYGQKHDVELHMAKQSAGLIGVKKHLFIDIDLGSIGGSALTTDLEVPKNTLEVEKQSTIPITYVPARNTIFLSLALAWAEVMEAEDIFIGVNAVDYSGYPDCRPEYIRSFEAMADLATKASVEGRMKYRIHAPLIDMSKADIIRKGVELGVDHSLTWSCYDPHIVNMVRVPCMKCDSCLLREKGFKEAGKEDPVLKN